MRDLVARIVLRTRDLATRPIRRFQNRLSGVRGAVIKLGAAITTYLSVRGITNFFVGAIKESAGLEEQLANVEAVSGATSEEMERLRAQAEEMGARTTFNATQAAEAMETLARAGLDTNESIEALPQVLAMARGNSIELAEAAGLVTKATQGMGLEFSESARVADVLTAAAQNANTDVTGLGNALSYAAPTAQDLGLSLEETAAMVGQLADAGIDASRAGTALNNIFSQFQDSGSTFREELGRIGIRTDDFTEAMRQLESAGDDGADAINAVGMNAGPAMRAMLNEGMGSLEDMTQTLRDSEGAAQDAADTMDKTLGGATERLKSVWRTAKRAIADDALPELRRGIDDLAVGMREFVESADFERFGDSFTRMIRRMIAGTREFLSEFDVSSATDRASGALDGVGTAFARMGAAARAAANAMNATWQGINAVVGFVMGEIATALGKLGTGVNFVVQGMNKVGLATDSFAESLEMHVGALNASADAMKEHARESAGEFVASAKATVVAVGDMVQANDENAEATEQSTEATQAQIDKLWEVTAAHQDAAGATQEQRDRLWELTGATQAAAAENDRAGERVRELSREYDRLKASGTATAQELGEALQRIDEATSEAEQATMSLAKAYQKLDIESQEAIQHSADEAREALDVVRQSSEATQEDIQRAFEVYAKAIVDTGDETQIAMARAEGKALGLGDALDDLGLKGERAGQKIKKGMDDAGDAAKETAEDAKNVGDEGEDAGKRAASGMDFFSAALTGAREEVSALSIAARNAFEERIGGNEMVQEAENTTEALNGARDELNQMASQRRRMRNNSFAAWFQDTSIAAKQTTVEFLEQRQALEQLTESVEQGGRSMDDLNRLADGADRRFDMLDSQDLGQLQNAIEGARSRMRSLRDESESTLESMQDDLLRLQGREDELAERRRERQREELKGDLAQAEAVGDQEATRNLREALRTLDKITREEQQQRKEQQEEERRREQEQKRRERERKQEQERNREAQARTTQPRQPDRTVRIQIGNTGIDVPENQADGFLRELERAGVRSQ